jgi:hypothetical protein
MRHRTGEIDSKGLQAYHKPEAIFAGIPVFTHRTRGNHANAG